MYSHNLISDVLQHGKPGVTFLYRNRFKNRTIAYIGGASFLGESEYSSPPRRSTIVSHHIDR